jgi:EmrB/QacA subfamily drug resistance transporter
MTTETAKPQHQTLEAPAHRWWVLTAVEFGNFVVYMDGFIVTLALPAMARHFDVGIREIKWVLIAYLATVTVMLLLAGRLGDRFGRKTVTVAGVAFLTVGAVLCALAPNLASLIAFRVVQGLGGALILANVMAAITGVFPPEQRRRAMAINASVLALGQITGLVLGGFLLDWLGWRSLFLLIGVIGGVGLVLDLMVLHNLPARPGAPMDWLGAALSAVVVGAPFLLIERLSRDFQDPLGLVFLLVSLIFLGAFLLVERRATWPLLDLQLFRSGTFTCGAAAASFYFMAATFGYFLLPLYAQLVLRLSPFAAGLLLVPLAVALSASSQLVGQWSNRLSARFLSTLGLICTSIAVLGMSLLGATPSYAYIVAVVVLCGTGGGLFHPPNNISVLSGVARPDLGAANGFFTTARNFGQAIGAALAGTLLGQGMEAAGFKSTLVPDPASLVGTGWVDNYLQSQAFAFRVGATLGLLGAVISALRGSEVQAASAAGDSVRAGGTP